MNNITDSNEFSSFLKSDLKEKLSPANLNSFVSELRQSLPEEKRVEFDQLLDAKNGSEIPSLDNKVNNGDNPPQKGISSVGLTALKTLTKKEILFNVKEALRIVGCPEYVLLCNLYSIPNLSGVALVRYILGDGESNSTVTDIEWNKSHMCHCRNVWLCPSCRQVIFGGRCDEINKAFKSWNSEGGSCYMLTLTARHTSNTKAVQMIPALKSAYKNFRYSRVWKEMWKECGSPLGNASVIGNYEFTYGRGGIHPHRHLLFFMKKSPLKFSDRLKAEWVRSCKKWGLISNVNAIDFSLIENSGAYLSKIGYELSASGYSKESKDGSRLNYPQLCYMVTKGVSWAKGQLKDYIKAVKGLRALHWSKGLKEYFKVQQRSDEEVIQNRVKMYVAWISGSTARRLPIEIMSALEDVFNMVHGNINDANIKDMCKALQIDLYDDLAQLKYNYGLDTEEEKKAIVQQFRLEINSLNYLSDVPISPVLIESESESESPPPEENIQGLFDF